MSKAKQKQKAVTTLQLIFGFFKKSGVEYTWDGISAPDIFLLFDSSGLQKPCIQKFPLLTFH